MSVRVEDLAGLYSAWRARYTARDARFSAITSVVQGEFSQVDPDEENVESRSPNLIQVALDDTADSASLVPTLRVRPSGDRASEKKSAARMERVGWGYLAVSQVELLLPQTVANLSAYGLGVWVVWPDRTQGIPLIERKDPRVCYPEPGFRPGDVVRRCMFAQSYFLSQLDEDWRTKLVDGGFEDSLDQSAQVTIVEYYDEAEYVIAGLYEASSTSFSRGASFHSVELDRIAHNIGMCPVVIGSRFALDGEIRGQFDQVIGPLLAHVRLMGMVLDYADQSVYSDVWVRDLIGEMPFGGGGYIELGPNGAIGRVPPAVTSLNVNADLQMLEEGIHIGARWPKARPGDIDQAIASAKFVEATSGLLNTQIKTYHTLLKKMLEQALRVAYTVDQKLMPGSKTASGVLRNREFVEHYHTDDINLDHRVTIEYGLGFGRDPQTSAVLHIQYWQNELVSQETVMENIDGISDVPRERSRIDVGKLRDMAMAKMLMALEAGELPEEALIAIARGREQGEDIFDLYEEHIVKPREAAAAAALETGLGGPPVLPGPMGPGGGEQGLSAPGIPPAPEPSQLLNRLAVPVPGVGVLGSQVTS